ncbi:hypothetical protein ACU3L3_07500 [Priestia endophytica]
MNDDLNVLDYIEQKAFQLEDVERCRDIEHIYLRPIVLTNKKYTNYQYPINKLDKVEEVSDLSSLPSDKQLGLLVGYSLKKFGKRTSEEVEFILKYKETKNI